MARSSKIYGFVAKTSKIIIPSGLEELRTQLMELTSLENIVDHAVKIVQEKLSAQTAAIFLFEKEDFMKRVAFIGFDKEGKSIETSWLSDESYKRGVGFTGRSLVRRKTQRTTDIYAASDDSVTRDQYLSKLGSLKASIVVPLLGSNHPFGALRVINRFDNQNQPISFNPEDEEWLTIVGSYLAAAISELRQKRKDEIVDNLIKLNTNPRGEGYPANILSQIAADLVGELTPYKACIIRTVDHDGNLVIAAKAPMQDGQFTWDGKDTDPRIPGQGIVGEVYATKTEQIHEKADNYRDKLINPEWFKANNLESFACYPLLIEGNAIGTLSLFTQFVHEFSPSEIEHFRRLSWLIAKLVMKITPQNIKDAVHEINFVNTEPWVTDRTALTTVSVKKRKLQYLNQEGDIPIDKIEAAVKAVMHP